MLHNYTWLNSKISFDNVGIAYLALFQVVSLFLELIVAFENLSMPYQVNLLSTTNININIIYTIMLFILINY